ncbi:MAG: transporter substrate-binding domain-containing protein [Pseudodesulfovibrio sp.]
MLKFDSIKRSTIWCFALLFCLGMFSTQARAETIIVAADEWCPFNCAPDSDAPGYAIELLEAIFTPLGHTIEYIVMPWKRVLHDTQEGHINAAVGVLPEEAPKLIFPEMEYGEFRVGFFRTNPDWKYTGKESVSNMVFGTAQGYSYGPTIDKLIADGDLKTEAVSNANPLELNLQKMMIGRIDGIIADHAVLTYTAQQMDLADSIHYAGSADPGVPLYVAFSPKNKSLSDNYATILSDGIRKLRKSGELSTILAKYQLTDWR